ncbi:hypothetical protein FS837_012657 [Tulasnella sp. UAMH 9824]|nr:hypothetical protein FS837_012657 [Tulasnella sp. UAMH 9824]
MDKIPTEILIHILLFCFPSKKQRKARKSLSRVCHFWTTAIYGSPLFWTEVGLHRTTEELREILRRNPHGPLDVSWTPSNPGKFMDDAAMQRVAMISPHSHRWRSLVLAGWITNPIQSQLIDVPTPRLINFSVVRPSSRPYDLGLAKTGTPLREITLGGTVLDWDHPRLRGLQSLRLHTPGAKAPTMEQLHAILSASPGLEILDLAVWTYESQDQTPLEKLGTVLLPSLTTLAVEKVQPIVLRTLLSCIQAPNCKYIRLPTISQLDFLDNYPLKELGKLSQGPVSTVPRLFMTYNRIDRTCIITHRESGLRPQPNIRESSLKLAQRRGVYLQTEPITDPSLVPDTLRLKEKSIRKYIQEVIQSALRGRSIELQLTVYGYSPSLVDVSHLPSVVSDLLLNMPLVTHLLTYRGNALELLPFLSARQPIRTMDGETGQGFCWPLPLLETLTVRCRLSDRPELLKALKVLISQRGSGTHNEMAVVSVQADIPADTAPGAVRPLKHIFLHTGGDAPVLVWDSQQGWHDETMASGVGT